MSDETSTAPEDILDDLALRHALGTLDGAERSQFETCMGCPHSRAATLVVEYRELVAAVSLAAVTNASPPPPEVKQRVLVAIRENGRGAKDAPALPQRAAMFFGPGDLTWMPTPYRGVRIREMSSTSPDFAIIMMACDPGSTFPAHDHGGGEDVYILSGDVTVGDRLLHAGDFMHSDAGSHHDAMISHGGCQALIITSRKNYSPHAARAYGVAHRVVSRIGRALGVAAKN